MKWPTWMTAFLVVLIAGGWSMACTQMTRYQMLTFFFDGVPDPNAPVAEQQQTPEISEWRMSLPEVEPVVAPSAMIVSRHEPVTRRQCDQCHQSGTGMVPLAFDAQLCDRCHRDERVNNGWDHGPISLGTCLPCHRAHESPFPHLLDQPQPELCFYCHETVAERRIEEHQVEDFGSCTRCHDPHRMKTNEDWKHESTQSL